MPSDNALSARNHGDLPRDQCEELRGFLTKRHQDEVCRERGEQLRLKQEQRKRMEEGV